MRLKPNEDVVSVLFSVRLPYVCDAVVFLTQIQTLYTFMQTFQQHKQHPKRMVRIKVIPSLVSLISSSEQPGSEKWQLKPLQHHHTGPQTVSGQACLGRQNGCFSPQVKHEVSDVFSSSVAAGHMSMSWFLDQVSFLFPAGFHLKC